MYATEKTITKREHQNANIQDMAPRFLSKHDTLISEILPNYHCQSKEIKAKQIVLFNEAVLFRLQVVCG